jgi:predicted GH43/DUF377 family glycosyl hydrolase
MIKALLRGLTRVRPLAVTQTSEGTVLLFSKRRLFISRLYIANSVDGITFAAARPITLISRAGVKEKIKHCRDFTFSRTASGTSGESYTLSYVRNNRAGSFLTIATSTNLIDWTITARLSDINERGVVVPDYRHRGQYALYYGELFTRLAFSPNLQDWYKTGQLLLAPRADRFDSAPLKVISIAHNSNDTLFLTYESTRRDEKGEHLSLGAAIFSGSRLDHIEWRSNHSLITEEYPVHTAAASLGTVIHDGRILYYVTNAQDEVLVVDLPYPQETGVYSVIKSAANPIISPQQENDWEAIGAFNPAVIDLGGKVHILYRALSESGISSIGYATSEDGVTINERLGEPIYTPRAPFEGAVGKPDPNDAIPGSGGGWGGCEDPKAVVIGNRVYLTYVAFKGTWPGRTAISSISIEDFLDQKWDCWSEPALLSADHLDCKSACLLPEKVQGKYVIFHRVWPDILIDYVDDLDFSSDTKWLHCSPGVFPWKSNGKVVIRHGVWPEIVTEETEFSDEYDLLASPRWQELTRNSRRISARPEHWDSHKISMGAAPVKTDAGWLAIYSAVDKKDFSKYKIGAMLLDKDDPSKVLHRSSTPVIVPDQWYENDGKPGVVYPGGLIARDNQLLIYYGGADKVVCVAHSPLDEFVHNLKHDIQNAFSFNPVTLS